MRRVLMVLGAFTAVAILLMIIAAVVMFVSVFSRGDKAEQEVDVFIAEFYDQAGRDQWQIIYDQMAHPQFKDAVTADRFESLFSGIYLKLGPVSGMTKTRWYYSKTFGGTFYEIVYDVERQVSPSIESFRLLKEDSQWKLLYYHINSDGLLDLSPAEQGTTPDNAEPEAGAINLAP